MSECKKVIPPLYEVFRYQIGNSKELDNHLDRLELVLNILNNNSEARQIPRPIEKDNEKKTVGLINLLDDQGQAQRERIHKAAKMVNEILNRLRTPAKNEPETACAC